MNGEQISKNQRILLEQKLFRDLPQQCVQCERPDNLTLDHIVPKYILEAFGMDTSTEIIEDNYQILCKVCNKFKSSKLEIRHPKTKEILLRLIEKI